MKATLCKFDYRDSAALGEWQMPILKIMQSAVRIFTLKLTNPEQAYVVFLSYLPLPLVMKIF